MKNISDNELVGEINRRLDEYNRAPHDLKMLTQKLETVNRKLQESEATKSDFLSNIRNEINNPLTSIMGLSKHLVDGRHGKEEGVSIAQNIFHEAFDLDFQLNNIFIAAEIEAGESPVGIAKIEVENFINRIIDSFDRIARRSEKRPLLFTIEENMELVTASMVIVALVSASFSSLL